MAESLDPETVAQAKTRLLTRLLEKKGLRAPAHEGIRPRESRTDQPLSFAQQRMWFLEQMDPGQATYNIALCARLEGPLRVSALYEGLHTVIERHESLRTVFTSRDGEPRQVVVPPPTPPLSVVDLSGMIAHDRDALAAGLAEREAQRPFDLSRPPLLRLRLLRLAPDEHVLVLVTHHIVSDGWSLGVLVRELGEVYLAAARKRPVALPRLPVQYPDYAIWQRERLRGERLSEEIDWWRRELAGAPELLELPTDLPRPAMQSFRGANVVFGWPPELTDRLRAFGREHDATLFMVLLTGFVALMARYTRQDDMVIGTPVAGRVQPELESLIGLFVNTLALRARYDDDADFRTLLARVRGSFLDAYSHQELPFERLVEVLRPDRSLSHSPLVQVFFDLQSAPTASVEWPDLRLRPFAGGSELLGTTAKFDLSLTMGEAGGGLEANVEYNTDLFRPDTVERLIGHYRSLLENVLDHPDRPMPELSMLTAGERDWVLAAGTPHPARAAGHSLHELVQRHAALRPDSVAVVWGDRQLTYRALNARANRLARLLRARGVGPETRVGLMLDRSLELVVALVAVLKAGGAYVPVDPDHPLERRALLLEDAGVSLVITDVRDDVPMPSLVVDDEDLSAQSAEDLPGLATAGNLAYVIYTSGTTGLPKGVQVSHENLASAIAAWQEAYALSPADRHLQMANATFDVFTGDLARALGSGAALVLCPRDLLLEPARLAALADEQQITCAEFVPVVLRYLLAELHGRRLPAFRLLVCGGDGWPAPEYRQARRVVAPSARVVNSYGVTEATIDSSFFETDGLEPEGSLTPVGRPLGHARLYVLDRHGHPSPIGVPGELCLGGAGVARGYLGRVALTAERFAPDPFGEPGARLYRTGDLARWLPDGDLEFLGRVDHQIKIRGHRVEPGEVEAVLAAHPDVRTAVVIARTDLPGEPRLVGYVVARDGSAPHDLADTLRAEARRRLPAYLAPAAVVVLDTLPLTPSGKVDRRALPAPALAPAETDTFVEAVTPAEQALAGVWAEVLGLEAVGVEDNFFALGGDSIVSLQVVARARTAGWTVSPKLIFENQTVRMLAQLALPVSADQPQLVAEQGIVTGPVPLTPIQCSLLDEQRPPAPHHYNQAVLLRSRERIDASAMERALQQVLRHHDALRLRLVPTGETWRQEQAGLEGVPEHLLQVESLEATPDDEVSAAITATATQVQLGFDLASGCLLKAVLFDLGPKGDSRLLLVIHHLAVDGVSWRVLLEDLQSAYQGRALPPKTTPFRDWARHLHQQGEEVAAEEPYWREMVESGGSTVPLDFPADAAQNTVSSVNTVLVTLSEAETRALLREVPKAYRTQINDVLLCVLTQALAPWVGQRRVQVELESHGREDVPADLDLSRTVGWFTSFHPVSLDLGAADDQGVMLKRIKEQLRAVPRGGLGYGLLRYLAGHLAVPRPDVAFNYLGQFDQSFRAEALWEPATESTGPMHDPGEPRENVLDITAVISAARLEVAWSHSTNLHRESTIAAVADRFVGCLRELIAHCMTPGTGGCTPSDFPLAALDQAALDRVLEDGREVEDVYPLSPMQQGMVFHTAHAPGSGIYVEQFSCRLVGELDAAALRAAWEGVIDRHSVLRTSVHWAGLAAPVQVVHSSVTVPWEQEDWRGLTKAQQDERLASLMAGDRAQGFELERPPLLRFFLIRLADDVHHFVFSHHHVVLDGWSFPRVIGEALSLYLAAVRGESASLSPARTFREYIAWLLRQDHERAEAYWRQLLAGYGEPSRLELGQPGSGEAAGCVTLTVSQARTAGLNEFARRHQVTLNTLVQAAWALLLSRYLGTDDVVFGMTVSGRPADLPGVEDMVGLLINTLPVRLRPQPQIALAEWLRQVQAQLMESLQYDYTPLASIQGWCGLPPDTPLFESIVVFENYPVQQATGSGPVALEMREVENLAQINYPLTLSAAPGDVLPLQLWYDQDRFPKAAVTRMLGHLRTLLENMADADGSEPVSRLDVLAEHELQSLLREGSGAPTAEPVVHGIGRLFAQQAARTPEGVALVHAEGTVTYRDLDVRANRLAHRLLELGVRPEDRVAILQQRSVELVVSMLAVLKAGGAYVPLDPRSPDGRLAAVVAQSGARLLLTDQAFCERECTGSATRVIVDALASAQPDTDPGVDQHPDQLAYVMHTSGSTGVPKGVAVTHRDVIDFTLDRRWRGGNHRRILMHSPYAFDASIYELWVPLLSGTEMVIAPPGDLDVGQLAELISEQAITALWLTAGLFRLLAEESPGCFAQVREVWSGGDVVPPASVRQVLEACPDLVVGNGYGPTETTVFATRHLMRAGVPIPATVPIGRPMDGMRVYVLDVRLQLTPPGVAGEVYLAGAGVARGYLGQPLLTAERFVADPYGPPGQRMYRTGDLARWNDQGRLEFVGRADEQVKIRGFRVETGEIEGVLREHPAVRQTIVLARSAPAGARSLTAYVVPQDGEPESGLAVELRAHCAAMLPDYMVPVAFLLLDGLPLTPNGKVDRATLPAPDQTALVAYAPPQTPVQSVIVGVWQEVFGVERVGIHDSFFDLGGDSMRALRLTGQLQRTLGRGVSLALLYQSSTPAELAATLERPSEPDWPPAVITLRATGTQPPLFCVHPKNGTVFCFTSLARALDDDRPIYGIQAHSLELAQRPHTSIEDMATAYLPDLIRVQPEGPYHLCGYSLGGLIAYEMARQLRAQGREVARLILLDSSPIFGPELPTLAELDAMDDVDFLMSEFSQHLPVTEDALRALPAEARLPQIMDLAGAAGLLAEHMDLRTMSQYVDIARDHTRAALAYEPEPYPGPALLLRCVDPAEDEDADPRWGWDPLVQGGFEMQIVPGAHITMLDEPHLSAVVERLRAYLATGG
ncbi:MAG: non-ribosomal peptide synthetase [Actinomycetia bacterium]|nr:non-ribosomal peptide synthetase [Actinomycetes bacterium]